MGNLTKLHHRYFIPVADAGPPPEPVQETTSYLGIFTGPTSGSVTIDESSAIGPGSRGWTCFDLIYGTSDQWNTGVIADSPWDIHEVWVQADLGESNAASFWKWDITSPTGNTQYGPTEMGIYGSDNGSSWTYITHFTSSNSVPVAEYVDTVYMTASVEYLTEYRYHRLSITAAYTAVIDGAHLAGITFYRVS